MNKYLIVFLTLLFTVNSFSSLFSINASASPGWINVYSPSSESIYYDGETILIRWTSFDIGNYVKIDLYRSESFYTTISYNTSNTGYYSWLIPNGYSSSNYYKIRITSLMQSNEYDESSIFYINQKTITVTSPVNGQTIYKGDTQSIQWQSEDSMHYYKIELYRNNNFIETISSSKYSSSRYGYYLWTVPSDITVGSSYKIKITDLSNNNIYGFSGTFLIDERYINIQKPSSDETLYKGEDYTIKWTSKNAGNQIKIEYKKEYDYYYTSLATYISNTGEHIWTVPNNLNTEYRYQIKITSLHYQNTYDISGLFTIDERYIIVKTPGFKDNLPPNEIHNIKWESKNAGDKVDIRLLKNNFYYSTIATNIDNNGSYNWRFENIFSPDSDYSIQIISKTYSNVYGQSNKFTIEGQTINIKSPENNDIWYKGETYEVLWESENAGDFVNIQLYNNKKYAITIASDIENTGQYKWKKIPSDLTAGSSYTIKITSVSYEDVYAFSKGNFTIQDTFFNSIIRPIIILVIIFSIIILTAVFLKRKKIFFKNKKEDHNNTTFESKPYANRTELTAEEYDNIWEGKK